MTVYISPATAETTGADFTLAGGEKREFYVTEQLMYGEFVEAFIKDEGASTYKTLGTLIDRYGYSKELQNQHPGTRTFKLVKSATTQSIGVDY